MASIYALQLMIANFKIKHALIHDPIRSLIFDDKILVAKAKSCIGNAK